MVKHVFGVDPAEFKKDEKPAEPEKPAARKSATGPHIQQSSLYLPRAAYRLLREIAFAEEKKIHDLVIEGIDLMLAKRSYPSVAELKAKDGKKTPS